MSQSRFINPWAVIGISAGILLAGFWFAWESANAPHSSANRNSDTANIREIYAGLYQALWRQDEGNDSVLITATLATPDLASLLSATPDQSNLEVQLTNYLRSLDDRQLPFIVTVDSVSGAVPDSQLVSAATAGINGTSLSDPAWTALISDSRVVNAPPSATSQIGILSFTLKEPMDWFTAESVDLNLSGIATIPKRTFHWSKPGFITEVATSPINE